MDKRASTAFLLQNALTPSGWRKNLSVLVNSFGEITEIDGPHRQSEAIVLSGAVVPGLPNVHSHAFQRGFAGLAERAGTTDDSFWTWREAMYRFVGALDPDDVEAIASLAYVEMIEAGFTHVGEFHYLHHGRDGTPYANPAELGARHVAAAEATGLGLTLLPVFYAHGGFKGAPASTGQRRFLNTIDSYTRLAAASAVAVSALPRGRFGIAPHSLRAATLEELSKLTAAFPDVPVHIHVAEQVKEVEDCLGAHGTRPIALLADHVALDARWCLIHATHADVAERRAMLDAKLVAGLCPVTEANLGDGLFDAVDFMSNGGAVAVGTDSNVAISVTGELALLEYGQRLKTLRRAALAPRGGSTGRRLFDATLAGGAQALGLPAAGLTVGAQADFVVLDTTDIAFAGRLDDAILDTWLFGPATRAVKEVYCGGKRVVAEGRHILRERVEARAREVLERVAGA